jgi:hypothetical protein
MENYFEPKENQGCFACKHKGLDWYEIPCVNCSKNISVEAMRARAEFPKLSTSSLTRLLLSLRSY